MTFVYLISQGEDGPVKVGVANNPEARMATLQGGNPYRLSLAKSWRMFDRDEAFRVERAVLNEMHPYRMAGEWIDADVFGMSGLIAGHVNDVLMS